ncbi:hypothetical protein GGI35DRAFT_454878 [Trichoderma velutinum]
MSLTGFCLFLCVLVASLWLPGEFDPIHHHPTCKTTLYEMTHCLHSILSKYYIPLKKVHIATTMAKTSRPPL